MHAMGHCETRVIVVRNMRTRTASHPPFIPFSSDFALWPRHGPLSLSLSGSLSATICVAYCNLWADHRLGRRRQWWYQMQWLTLRSPYSPLNRRNHHHRVAIIIVRLQSHRARNDMERMHYIHRVHVYAIKSERIFRSFARTWNESKCEFDSKWCEWVKGSIDCTGRWPIKNWLQSLTYAFDSGSNHNDSTQWHYSLPLKVSRT